MESVDTSPIEAPVVQDGQPTKADKLYDGLIKSGFSQQILGDRSKFIQDVQDPIKANKLYSGLRASGYGEDVLGDMVSFRNNLQVQKKAGGAGSPLTSQPLPTGGIPDQSFQAPTNNITPFTPAYNDQQQAQKQVQAQQLSGQLQNANTAYGQAQGGNITPPDQVPDQIRQYKSPTLSDRATFELKSIAGSLNKGIANMVIAPLYHYGNKVGLVDDAEKARVLGLIDSSDKETFGLDPHNLQHGDNMVHNAINQFAFMAPALITASGTGGASFGLQTAGQAATAVQKMKDNGVKFDNHSDDLFILGSGIIGTALGRGTMGKIFESLGSTAKNNIVSGLTADAIKELGEKGTEANAQDIADAFMSKASTLADKVGQTGLAGLQTYAKVGTELSAANAATFGTKKLANAVGGNEPFKDTTGQDFEQSVAEPFGFDQNAHGNPLTALADMATSPAGAFGIMGGAKEALGFLGNNPNPSIEKLQQDNSPEAVAKLKQDIVRHGQEKGWNDTEIQQAQQGVDLLSNTVAKLPKNLKPEKVQKGVSIIMGRNDLQQQLEQLQDDRSKLDPSVSLIAAPQEELIQNKIDQANDKLRGLVTGDRPTYYKGTETDEGKFFKTVGGVKEEIPQSRYDLEVMERDAKKKPEEPVIEKGENTDATEIESPGTLDVGDTPGNGETMGERNPGQVEPAQQSEPQQNIGSSDAQQKQVKEPPIPNKPIDQMSSDDLYEHAKEIKQHFKDQEVAFFGEDGAKEYQRAIDIENGQFTKKEDRDKARETIDRYENGMTPEQRKAFDTPPEMDNESLRDLARHVNHIENAENSDELAGLIKNPLLDYSKDKNDKYNTAILTAAARRASELGVDPTKMLKAAIDKVVSDLPGKKGEDLDGDKELITKSILAKITKGSENVSEQKQIDDTAASPPQDTSGEPAQEPISDNDVKKTILTKRAYEGHVQPEVKKYLEDKGLTRQSFSQEERSKQATDFINKFGDDAAIHAVDTNDIKGGMAASVLAQLQIKLSHAMGDLPEGSDERDALAKKYADLIDMAEQKGYWSGEYSGQLAYEYQNPELNFANVKQQVESLTKKPLTDAQEKKVKDLTAENEQLKQKAQDAEAKLIEETDKAFEAGKEAVKTETNAQKAKRIADSLRKNAKLSRPGVFSSATPASLIWDSAIEVTAKSIELGGKLADAIDAGIKHIQESDWYKGLPQNKQELAEKEFKRFNGDKVGSTDLADLQSRFIDKKDNKFTTDEARDIWGYMKKTYIENGTSYRDAMSKTMEDLGLSWRQISEAITTPKLKRASDEMWQRQADLARNRAGIKAWVDDQNSSGPYKALKKISGFFRGEKVVGHGAIFVGTHAGMTLFDAPTANKTVKAFFNGWKFAYGKGGNYERSMEELKNSPNYIVAQRAGLKNNPAQVNAEEYQKSQKFLGRLGLAGTRGFNAIKVLRQDLFDYEYNKRSPAEKADPMAIKSIAHLVNLATGATNAKIPDLINELTFAGGMESARWEKLLASPVKVASTAVEALIHPSTASVADKIFAKVWARRAGSQIAGLSTMLLANAAIQNQINPQNKVNLADPDKPDWMKFKFGDITIDPTSGMRATTQFIYKLGKVTFEKKQGGDQRDKTAGKLIEGYARGKLAPLYSTLADQYAGDDFEGNVLPYRNDKPAKYAHKLTWGQYAWEQAPLPFAEGASIFYQSAVQHGADKRVLKNVLKAIALGALSGGTGARVAEYDANAPENKKKH